ncbi:MAG: hypothetical protein WCF12_04785 [Propionicimonas sp.]
MSAAYQSQAYDAIAYLDSATDVNRNGGSCTTATDAVFLQYAAADGTRGVTYCDHYKTLSSGAVVCDKYLIWLNSAYLGTSAQQIQKTACHELGHFASQDHHNAPWVSCMVSGAVGSESYWLTYYPHEIAEINTKF